MGTGTGILFPKNLLDNPDRATLTNMNICKHLFILCFSYGTGTGTAVPVFCGAGVRAALKFWLRQLS